MPDIIDLAAHRDRVAARNMARAAATRLLDTLNAQLFDAAFQLARAHAWRAWDEANPFDAILELDPAALLECDDAEVRALARLWVEVDRTLEQLADAEGSHLVSCSPTASSPEPTKEHP